MAAQALAAGLAAHACAAHAAAAQELAEQADAVQALVVQDAACFLERPPHWAWATLGTAAIAVTKPPATMSIDVSLELFMSISSLSEQGLGKERPSPCCRTTRLRRAGCLLGHSLHKGRIRRAKLGLGCTTCSSARLRSARLRSTCLSATAGRRAGLCRTFCCSAWCSRNFFGHFRRYFCCLFRRSFARVRATACSDRKTARNREHRCQFEFLHKFILPL